MAANPRTPILLKIDPALVEKLDAAAAAARTNRMALIVSFIEQGLGAPRKPPRPPPSPKGRVIGFDPVTGIAITEDSHPRIKPGAK